MKPNEDFAGDIHQDKVELVRILARPSDLCCSVHFHPMIDGSPDPDIAYEMMIGAICIAVGKKIGKQRAREIAADMLRASAK